MAKVSKAAQKMLNTPELHHLCADIEGGDVHKASVSNDCLRLVYYGDVVEWYYRGIRITQQDVTYYPYNVKGEWCETLESCKAYIDTNNLAGHRMACRKGPLV